MSLYFWLFPGLPAQQNRPYTNIQEVQRLLDGIRKRGMWSAGELMYLMDIQDAGAIFEQDLRLLAERRRLGQLHDLLLQLIGG